MTNHPLKKDLTEHRRLVNWWMRFEDLNWPSSDNLDRIKMRAEKMAEANITTAVLFGAHFRWDYLPYFTLLHDHIAAVAEELHKYGIELFDRHSINLIHRYDTAEQMRHVMLHSGPHLPFSPSREAAACWEYKGKKLNDWRMLDVISREPLYYPQYAGEGFCYRNPEFVEAYCDYAKRLVADTGIDGLAAEDAVHYMHFRSCACPHCRQELKRRTGMDLPPVEDRSFWGNWENPAWKEWIDLRFAAGGDFFEKLQTCLPENFPITTCGSDSSGYSRNGAASDARIFVRGSNYVHSEWSGNTPPYRHDPVTVNISIDQRVVGSSHHLAVAHEKGYRCFTTGYGFTEPSANIIWALNKVMDQDCCFSTLKARLGLPQHVLDTLPEEYEVIGNAYTFEKDHPELFEAEQICQLGVYFSYKTRNHSLFGNLHQGYHKDYAQTLRFLFRKGISAETVFDFPRDGKRYPVILLSSAAVMTPEEIRAMEAYLASGGKVIATGPSGYPGCEHRWALPTRPEIEKPEEFFDSIAHGVWRHDAQWIKQMRLGIYEGSAVWQEPRPGLYYHPYRVSDGQILEELLALCLQLCKPMPVRITRSEGYLVTAFSNDKGLILHLLAENYDVDIDHHLDEIRFHRSRVNYIDQVEPKGTTQVIRGIADKLPTVYTPFSTEASQVLAEGDGFAVKLPEKTAYAILFFENHSETF